jgi:hypothetical protein
MEENHRLNVEDPGVDILSYSRRRNNIHILTLDRILADDVYERIRTDPRTEGYTVKRPTKGIQHGAEEIESMAPDTVSSRLLIIDVRKSTLPLLQHIYNKVVGYNRRDLNKLCYIVLIGDGPINLFHAGKFLDDFVPYLAKHRLDYYPAAFFYDPFLHYEPDEISPNPTSLVSLLPTKLPKRLAHYFKEQAITVTDIRKFFRADGKKREVKLKRLEKLTDLYKKRIKKQFSKEQCDLDAMFTHDGILLATERLHLYPFFFEDWVFELIEKAANNS